MIESWRVNRVTKPRDKRDRGAHVRLTRNGKNILD